MGYFSSEHIKQFCWGKTIKDIQCDSPFDVSFIKFKDGSYIKIINSTGTRKKICGCEEEIAIAYVTPYDKDGNVKQSMDIMREIQP